MHYCDASSNDCSSSVSTRRCTSDVRCDSETSSDLHPLPPLAEQERIVAAIEEQFSRLDAGVAALERVRQNLKRMRAAVLQAAVSWVR